MSSCIIPFFLVAFLLVFALQEACGKTLHLNAEPEDYQNYSGKASPSGIHAQITDFPFMAKLEVRYDKHVMQCGGSLVHANWVLTAEHCVSSEISPVRHIDICMGSSYLPDMSTCLYRRSVKAISSPVDKSVDLAMLRLKQPFPSGQPTVQPLPVRPHKIEDLPDGCKVMGWGWMQPGIMSPNLLQTDVWRMKDCYTGMICVMASRHSPCRGDSGGPLLCSGLLAGVASVGENADCYKGDGITVYVPVGSSNMRFIETTINQAQQPQQQPSLNLSLLFQMMTFIITCSQHL